MKVSITIFLLFAAQISFCQTTPKEITKAFFDKYKEGDTDKAIDYLYSFSTDPNRMQETVKRQLKRQVEIFGKFFGEESLVTKTAGPNILMFTYLVRHQSAPLVFRIMFYKPNDKWQMNSFKFSSNPEDELEESSKLSKLKENF